MLVLSRKPGERLRIGEAVEVVILAVRGDQVSLGVCAPREIPIHREELLERIRRENRRAATLPMAQLEAMGERLRRSIASLSPRDGRGVPTQAGASLLTNP